MKLPHIIRYSRKEGGSSNFFFININESLKDDEGLHAHEYKHVEQWYACAGIGVALVTALALFLPLGAIACLYPFALASHGILYRLSRKLRLRWEVQAFKEQFKGGAKTEKSKKHYARALASDRYNFNITDDEAYVLLFK